MTLYRKSRYARVFSTQPEQHVTVMAVLIAPPPFYNVAFFIHYYHCYHYHPPAFHRLRSCDCSVRTASFSSQWDGSVGGLAAS